jgi:hypothetical protein
MMYYYALLYTSTYLFQLVNLSYYNHRFVYELKIFNYNSLILNLALVIKVARCIKLIDKLEINNII